MMSTQEGMASKKDGSAATGSAIRIEDGQDQATARKASDKRKADTDCKNREFELTLQERITGNPKNFKHENVTRINSMSTGKPPKERLNIPEGVDVFQYGN